MSDDGLRFSRSTNNPRRFREETNLNASEIVSLEAIADRMGISKSAVLRMGLLRLLEEYTLATRLEASGVGSNRNNPGTFSDD